jgi:hypothetical protein
MVLVIPGVEVSVTKEVVAPQLAPSGVLGLVGLAEKRPAGAVTVLSTATFVDAFGRASVYSMPDAALSLQNGVAELVVVAVDPASATAASVSVPADTGNAFTLTARAAGTWANELSVSISKRSVADKSVLDLVVSRGNAVIERIRGLAEDKIDETLPVQSDLLKATKPSAPAKIAVDSPVVLTLSGGQDASQAAYASALQLLESEPDVDMVLAAIQDFSTLSRVAAVYSGVIAHCARMSEKARGRIGFGQVPPFADPNSTARDWANGAAQFFSDRFVLLAPHGVAGAVAGMIGSLDYFQSPTFKAITGVTDLSRKLLVEEQEALLKANVVPVATMRGRGTVVVRGLTTDGDQISVRRVADHAVRGVQMIGELFIGRLNNETGRGALREKLVEFLVQMEKDGAIVPSTDRRDPAFKVNVYSTQDDFAKGIVRVDLAVRPVRAIDYIYATVLVQA